MHDARPFVVRAAEQAEAILKRGFTAARGLGDIAERAGRRFPAQRQLDLADAVAGGNEVLRFADPEPVRREPGYGVGERLAGDLDMARFGSDRSALSGLVRSVLRSQRRYHVNCVSLSETLVSTDHGNCRRMTFSKRACGKRAFIRGTHLA